MHADQSLRARPTILSPLGMRLTATEEQAMTAVGVAMLAVPRTQATYRNRRAFSQTDVCRVRRLAKDPDHEAETSMTVMCIDEDVADRRYLPLWRCLCTVHPCDGPEPAPRSRLLSLEVTRFWLDSTGLAAAAQLALFRHLVVSLAGVVDPALTVDGECGWSDDWWTAPAPSRPAPVSATGCWAADPFGRHEYRYWDGSAWTDHVSDAGRLARNPPSW